MKKILTLAIIFIITIMATMTAVNAATSETLGDELYAIGSKYGMTASDKLKIERYLNDYPVTEDEANEILALAQQADKIMQEEGKNYKDLSKAKKDELKELANKAANIAKVTLVFKTNSVEIYKDGKLIETISSATTGKLAYTGNSSNIVLVISLIAVIALTATAITVAKKN